MKRIIALCLFVSLNTSAEIKLNDTLVTISNPNGYCKLGLSNDKWTLVSQEKRPDGKAAYYLYTLDGKPISFSVYIDQSTECTAGNDCLELALKNPAYKNAEKISKYELAGFHVAEVTIDFKELVGLPFKQLNLVAEKYNNGCWYDVHLSQGAADTPDADELLTILLDLKN